MHLAHTIQTWLGRAVYACAAVLVLVPVMRVVLEVASAAIG